jgi:hypothetical protein
MEGVMVFSTIRGCDDYFSLLRMLRKWDHIMAGQLILQPWWETHFFYNQNIDLSLTFSINVSPHFIT